MGPPALHWRTGQGKRERTWTLGAAGHDGEVLSKSQVDLCSNRVSTLQGSGEEISSFFHSVSMADVREAGECWRVLFPVGETLIKK